MEAQEFNNLNKSVVTFTHIEKGHTYKVIDIILSKHPDTGKWYDAVLYIQLESSKQFVRSKESFLNNFKIKNKL